MLSQILNYLTRIHCILGNHSKAKYHHCLKKCGWLCRYCKHHSPYLIHVYISYRQTYCLLHYHHSLFLFDTINVHPDMLIYNHSLSVKRRNTGDQLDAPIYGNTCMSKGIHTWKIKVDKCDDNVGVGIIQNKCDMTYLKMEHFLFANGVSYNIEGTAYKEGDVLTLILNMNEKTFIINGPTFTTSTTVKESSYYACFEIYGDGNGISIIQ